MTSSHSKALAKAQHGRTTIIVAHRLSTIREVDQIFVIDRGVCVEQGTYDELCETSTSGIFKPAAAEGGRLSLQPQRAPIQGARKQAEDAARSETQEGAWIADLQNDLYPADAHM